MKVLDANGYLDRPRLTKPYLEADLVRAVAGLIARETPAP